MILSKVLRKKELRHFKELKTCKKKFFSVIFLKKYIVCLY